VFEVKIGFKTFLGYFSIWIVAGLWYLLSPMMNDLLMPYIPFPMGMLKMVLVTYIILGIIILYRFMIKFRMSDLKETVDAVKKEVAPSNNNLPAEEKQARKTALLSARDKLEIAIKSVMPQELLTPTPAPSPEVKPTVAPTIAPVEKSKEEKFGDVLADLIKRKLAQLDIEFELQAPDGTMLEVLGTEWKLTKGIISVTNRKNEPES
jgi:hypothetical protein